MLQLLLYVFGALALLILYLLAKWYRHLSKYRNSNIPGPKPLPILGNILEFGTSLKDILGNFQRLQQKYGGIFKVHLGINNCKLILTDPKYIQHILGSSKLVDKSNFYDFYNAIIENGIVIAKADIWRKNRRLFSQCFHVQLIEQFGATYNSASDGLIKKLGDNVHKEIDVHEFISVCMLEVITETAMGVKFSDNIDKHVAYIGAVHSFFKVAMSRVFSLLYASDFAFSFTEEHKKQEERVRFTRDYVNGIIVKRIDDRKAGRVAAQESDEFGIKGKVAFLDQLIEMYGEDYASVDEIRHQIVTFFIAGYDTSAACLSFLFYELSHSPDVQDKIYAELVRIEAANKDVYTTNDFNNMKYMECVIKETLRKYPSVPMYERIIEEDLAIEDVTIPKDTVATIFAYGAHRWDQNYPEPDKFDPDRFLPENCAERNQYAFLAFSAGPRNCLGMRFAMSEMKCVVAKVIKNFRLLPKSNFELELITDIVLTSANGFPLILEKRTK